jgi:hypothetical protein
MIKDYVHLMPKFFDVLDPKGNEVPFVLNDIQKSYMRQLKAEHPDAQGIRDNVLKARRQGFSALIDGMLTLDFLTIPNIGGQVVSHKADETLILFNRISYFIDSFCRKSNVKRKDILKEDTQEYLENRNGSFIFIGTAGAKTLGRGGALQNLHWSEVGFYPNTQIINAEKLVTGAEQQVPMGVGKIFRESTGNVFGDFYHGECARSRKNESSFAFRFFPWYLFGDYQLHDPNFTPNEKEVHMMQQYNLTMAQICWYHQKGLEFKSEALFLREYPTTPEEAFLAAGASYFNADALKWYFENVKEPIQSGYLAADGGWV